MSFLKKIKINILSSLLLGLLLAVVILFIFLPSESYRRAIFPQDKIWLHRVNSLQEAMGDEKWGGVEIDVWFYENEFLVGHTLKEAQDSNLKLIDHVEKLGLNIRYFWIDFKNLSFSNKSDARKEAQDLITENKDFNFFFESKNYWNQLFFCQKAVQCILWDYKSDSIFKQIPLLIIKRFTYQFASIVLTSFSKEDLPDLESLSKNSKIGVFTFPSESGKVAEMERDEKVQIILVKNKNALLE